jgi:hypothetical protein
MQENAHVLVVANRTAASPELLGALAQRASEGPVCFTLVVPATAHGLAWAGDMHSGGDQAEANMKAATKRLHEAGLEVQAKVGDQDPVSAVTDEINLDGSYSEVIVSTLPKNLSRWLKVDLPRRVERATDLPVRHVVASEANAPGGG